MLNMRNTTLTLMLMMVMAGCSLLPADKSRSEATQATEAIAASHDLTIKRALEVGPEMVACIAPDAPVTSRALPPIREELTVVASSSQSGGSRATAKGDSSTKLSLGAKLILAGIGVFLLTAALLFAWKHLKGTAIGQGIALADDVLARRIRTLRERATLATDAAEIARVQAEIADLEAERGRNKR
jgi:DMSO reductase anchor subunit